MPLDMQLPGPEVLHQGERPGGESKIQSGPGQQAATATARKPDATATAGVTSQPGGRSAQPPAGGGKYGTRRERRAAGVCVQCEGTPVVAYYRCAACYAPIKAATRGRMRVAMRSSGRSHWDPEKQILVLFDDRAAYDAVRARIAAEMTLLDAKGLRVCKKYRISWVRLQIICREHGVILTRRRGRSSGQSACEDQKISPAANPALLPVAGLQKLNAAGEVLHG